MEQDKMMRIGLSMRYLGYHMAAWRHPDVPAGGAIDFKYFLDSARKAEAAKLDMIFFADGIGVRASDTPKGSLTRDSKNAELEPLTLLAAIGAHTSNIGLVATASTTYNEPFHIARKYASLDHISGGRAGWNVVTSWSQQEAWNFSRDEHLGYEERYERADEFVDVVKKLWDSWEDDAFIRNKETGIFYEESKLHVANHKGKHFSVRGPLNSARTPQGRPIVVQAGAAEAGRELAAKNADVVYSASFDISSAQKYYADLKSRLGKYGRTADQMLIMPGLTTYVGKTRQEAQDKYDQLQELIDPLSGLAILHSTLGDLSGYDLDGPVPDIGSGAVSSIGGGLIEMARRENMTIRQLYKHRASGGRQLIGTAADIVDDMETWFKEGAADGFNLCPAILPNGLEDFVEFILPELRKRGLFRTEYASSTLRGNLGLKPLQFGD
ncbi:MULTISPECIES: LLM class flavin-dependent oxidoreductase [Burkholderiaceae]|uniref:Putative monooxygenase RutA in pyrimidine catabolism pathway n=2 Tax=Caballeronia TaxID=1827195 RepID=A0A242MH43_CABSO|nr:MULTISPECIES: LLM class flavin-dependent oxidoreductase [Burkholderiaceae]AMH42979.1 nitrilotriacetate monooxygenase [Burkholderia sp. PAMC 26561]AMM16055.1 nitrilotriacetate monooxygenase [Burkholderia sp. PAMC 28687]MDP9152670.1 LLM class flavin-dependent oxidoreductase [Pseudomonadota bacterium]OTP70622.1 putative monooxygenase RutA in pyrimidine catabolism pathway [Caballeronia sordidicola]